MLKILDQTTKHSPRLALALAAFVLVGCASSGPQRVASSQACPEVPRDRFVLTDVPNMDSPPKLVLGSVDKNRLEWDDPSKFGRVPRNLSQRGDNICSILGRDVVAVGYHPGALDVAGNVIAGGGFLCGRI